MDVPAVRCRVPGRADGAESLYKNPRRLQPIFSPPGFPSAAAIVGSPPPGAALAPPLLLTPGFPGVAPLLRPRNHLSSGGRSSHYITQPYLGPIYSVFIDNHWMII